MMDIDGDPYSYHVEFLGNPHSHSWVPAKHVEMYGHKHLQEIESSQSQSQSSVKVSSNSMVIFLNLSF